jgi:hypothetical protein
LLHGLVPWAPRLFCWVCCGIVKDINMIQLWCHFLGSLLEIWLIELACGKYHGWNNFGMGNRRIRAPVPGWS